MNSILYCLDIIFCPHRFLQPLFPPPPPLMTATTASTIPNAVATTRVLDVLFLISCSHSQQYANYIFVAFWKDSGCLPGFLGAPGDSGRLLGIRLPPGNQGNSGDLNYDSLQQIMQLFIINSCLYHKRQLSRPKKVVKC